MPRASSALALVYSGGAGNTSAVASVGGAVSTATQRFAQSQSASGTFPTGVTFRFAAGNPTGSGTLAYAAATHAFTWTPNGGGPAVYTVSASGEMSIGSTVGGFLLLDIVYAALPVTDVAATLAIANVFSSVFVTPAGNELDSGVTEYCCLYIVNLGDEQLTQVSLTLTQDTPISAVSIGSDYAPVSTYLTTQAALDARPRFNPLTGNGAYTRSYAAAAAEKLNMQHRGGGPMFMYAESAFAQDSDGVSEDIPVLLASRYDSTNELALVAWGTSLYWPIIYPGRMVSFFLRRVVPPATVTASDESLTLTFSLIGV